jgi:hypothetical protein
MGEQVCLLLHFPAASSVAFSELMKGRPEHRSQREGSEVGFSLKSCGIVN